MTSTAQQRDAMEIAAATGTDFGQDPVGVIMKKYDTDGNGTFSIDECAGWGGWCGVWAAGA